MTRQEALDKGYCKHCAAYGPNWRCGITSPVDEDKVCILPLETKIRWKGEFGLEGQTQRFTGDFGDPELMKKKRGMPAKRYLK